MVREDNHPAEVDPVSKAQAVVAKQEDLKAKDRKVEEVKVAAHQVVIWVHKMQEVKEEEPRWALHLQKVVVEREVHHLEEVFLKEV